MKHTNVKYLSTAAIIAALYTVLTLISAALGLAIGPFEFRLSEALTILPVFTRAAVPGLTLGCFVSAVFCGAIPLDMLLGTLASFLGSIGTRCFRKKPLLAFLSPIAANTLIVPPVLYFAYGFKENGFFLLFLSFLVGESVSVGLFGFLLKNALRPFLKIFSER